MKIHLPQKRSRSAVKYFSWLPAAIIFLLIATGFNNVFAQAPVITYASPQTYSPGTAIVPLSPVNTGGAVATVPMVSTFAGNGIAGAVDGTGNAAEFNIPQGVAVDAAGNVYVADQGNNLIRKITPAGMVTTFAGANIPSNDVDGQGTAARFNSPGSIAVDGSGNVYVADAEAIRVISPDGYVATLNTNFGSTQIAADAAGNIYIATGSEVWKINPFGVASIVAPAQNFCFNPRYVTVDALGNVYASDGPDDLIFKITPAGVVTTFAGNCNNAAGSGTPCGNCQGGFKNGQGASAFFQTPVGLAADASGNVYVADAFNQAIRMISPAGLVTTYAGGAAGTLSGPISVAVDAANNVYVADGNTIKKIAPAGYTISPALPASLVFDSTTGIISGTPTVTSPPTPYTISAYNSVGSSTTTLNITVNNILPAISYPQNPIVVTTGIAFTISPVNTGGVPSSYSLITPFPAGIGFDSTTGIISGTPAVVSLSVNYNVIAHSSAGNDTTTINITVNSPPPVPIINYSSPKIYAIGTAITPLTVSNTGGAVPPATLVSTFAGSGAFGAVNGASLSASFSNPAGVALDAVGNLYVADYSDNLIRKINSAGVVSTLAGGFNGPGGLAVDAQGNVFVADVNNNVVEKITPSGLVSIFSDGQGDPTCRNCPHGFFQPSAVATSPSTFSNQFVLVADYGNHQVVFLGSDGTALSADLGDGGFSPRGIAIDLAGNQYATDPPNNRIFSLRTETTLAGSGNAGAANGTGLAASFNSPTGIATDAQGNIYVGDTGNNLVRKVTPAGVVTTLAGSGAQGSANGRDTLASFNQPYGLALDPFGVIYLADAGNNLIRKIVPGGYTISPALPAGLVFDSTTGTISGTATVLSPPTIYTITAYNSGGIGTATVSIQVVPGSNNANLANLTISSGTLNPAFASATTAYTATVSNAVSSISVTPSTADTLATIKVNGTAVPDLTPIIVPLAIGQNSITTVVTASDDTTTKTYTVIVTRGMASNNNANLVNLTISSGALSPSFSSAITSYTDTVSNISSFTFTPVTSDPSASIKVNGSTVPGSSPVTVPLAAGPNTITIIITAADGTTMQTYTLAVTLVPYLNAEPITGTISACAGSTSFSPNIQQFIVSGNNLSGNITATAPPNFEVSLASGSGYGNSVTLTPSNGMVGATVIYVRSAASASVGSITGNVTLTTNGAPVQNIRVTGVVNALPALSKVSNQIVNNGSTTAPVDFMATGGVNWVNDTPAIGLAASGTGNIPAFKAINNGSTPLIATITATPVLVLAVTTYLDTVALINTATYAVISKIPVSTTSMGVAASPDGKLLYVLGPGIVSVINTSTNAIIATIPVGANPNCISISADGSRVYVVDDSPVSINNTGDVMVINTSTNAVIATIPLGVYPGSAALTPDGTKLYIGGPITGKVSVVNTATNTVTTTLQIGTSATGVVVSPDGKRLYVINGRSGTGKVSVVNTATNAVIATIPVGVSADGITISPDGSKLYVINGFNSSVAVINTATNSVITTVPVGINTNAFYISVRPDGQKVYVVGSVTDSVAVIDAVTNKIINTVGLPPSAGSFGNFISNSTNSGACGGIPETFTITVNPTTSSTASLSNLTISNGTLAPVFASGTTSYTASVGNSVTSVTVTPTLSATTATVTVNGVSNTSGSPSASIPLSVGANTITTIVTAQNGTTTQTYTITVTRAALSSNASLANLTISSGALAPVFASGTTSYTASVGNSTSSVTVTPTLSDTTATVTVNGVNTASGSASTSIPLVVGLNRITTIVIAQDGTTRMPYSINITRAALSANASLANLTISSGSLAPVFASGTTSYTASVSNSTASVTVTPTLSDPTATVTVNGASTASGSASASIPLAVGANTITTIVTAQDGTTTKTYTIVVTRAALSGGASLANLKLSSGTLSPAFAAGGTSYTASVINIITSITVTPTAAQPSAAITVNGAAVKSGSPSASIPLSVGANTITIVVSNTGGPSTTYTVIVTRQLSDYAFLARLQPSVGKLTPSFSVDIFAYSERVGRLITSITVTPTAATPFSTIKVNGKAVISGKPSQPIALTDGINNIKIMVTAQNGINTNTYSLAVTKEPSSMSSPLQAVAEYQENNGGEQADGINVHQGISPNGDGINDILVIDGIKAYPENKLLIINRNGNLVFEANGYDNSSKVFDGHSNKTGAMQLPGTYFYSLEYKDGNATKHKTGFIVIKY